MNIEKIEQIIKLVKENDVNKVNKGDIIGYVEAMKVLNEVTTDVAGEITEIVADHGTNVEYDQVLVRIK